MSGWASAAKASGQVCAEGATSARVVFAGTLVGVVAAALVRVTFESLRTNARTASLGVEAQRSWAASVRLFALVQIDTLQQRRIFYPRRRFTDFIKG